MQFWTIGTRFRGRSIGKLTTEGYAFQRIKEIAATVQSVRRALTQAREQIGISEQTSQVSEVEGVENRHNSEGNAGTLKYAENFVLSPSRKAAQVKKRTYMHDKYESGIRTFEGAKSII